MTDRTYDDHDDYDDNAETRDAQPAAADQGQSSESDRLREIADKIQVGDMEEGARALGEMLQIAEERGRRSVGQAMVNAGRQAENSRAAARFINKYQVLAHDPDEADKGMGIIRDTLVDELKRAGLPDSEIAGIRNNIDGLGKVYTSAREQGLKVRPPDEVLADAGPRMEREGILPGRDGVNRARTARWINEERKARGFPVVDKAGARIEPPDGTRRTTAPASMPRPPTRTRDEEVRDRNRAFLDETRRARRFS